MTIMNKYFSKALNELSLNKLILIFATRFIKYNVQHLVLFIHGFLAL